MEGAFIVTALDADSGREVSIAEACAMRGQRDSYRCLACGNDLVAKCGRVRTAHFAHRFPGTTCLGRRLAPPPPAPRPPPEPSPLPEAWAAPADPERAAEAAAAWERLRPSERPPTPPSPPTTVVAQPPPPPDPLVCTPHATQLDAYLSEDRCLQLLVLFAPHAEGRPGGTLSWFTRDPSRDPFHLNANPLGDWNESPRMSGLHSALQEAIDTLRAGLTDVREVAQHQLRFWPTPVTDSRRHKFLAPLRAGRWDLI